MRLKELNAHKWWLLSIKANKAWLKNKKSPTNALVVWFVTKFSNKIKTRLLWWNQKNQRAHVHYIPLSGLDFEYFCSWSWLVTSPAGQSKFNNSPVSLAPSLRDWTSNWTIWWKWKARSTLHLDHGHIPQGPGVRFSNTLWLCLLLSSPLI